MYFTNRSSLVLTVLASITALLVMGVPVGQVDTPRATTAELMARHQVVDDGRARSVVAVRTRDDLAAMETFRPGYAFWQNIFTIDDGHIAFGSAGDGRLLAVFPTRGDWHRDGRWIDRSLASVIAGRELPRGLDDRRELVADLLEREVGPVLHNFTRGRFLTPNIERYGPFLAEWGAIYERFGVPADVGLAQAVLESGLDGTRRSEANAIGFCQWLKTNWNHLDKLSTDVIEAYNQTTQASYCAAYLTVLATKYGSYIPALSAHHAGNTNVGRVLINGERLGAEEPRERYFLGAQMVRDLRLLAPKRYSDIYSGYGPRSYRYAEMVFGNTFTVRDIVASERQLPIYAMRTSRTITIDEITRRTGLSADEVRRYNPALVKKVPEGGTLYLPKFYKAFGRDVTFWHRPADPEFEAVLNALLRVEITPEEWDQPAFQRVLRGFQRQFAATGSEEGAVMATMLGHEIDGSTASRRKILNEFRNSDEILSLFTMAVQEWDAARLSN